jgi:nucleotide-binding universal stress UspA family protein
MRHDEPAGDERVKVLIPLDGSAFSRQVVPYVLQVLHPGVHALTLLRVTDAPEGHVPMPSRPLVLDGWIIGEESPSDEPPIYQSQMVPGAVANLEEELLVDARALAEAGFEVHAEVRFGHAAKEIIDLVREQGFLLVVMATHGRSGVERVVLGSVAGAVLRHLHVPVMMVRPVPEVAGETLPVEREARAPSGAPAIERG